LYSRGLPLCLVFFFFGIVSADIVSLDSWPHWGGDSIKLY
jgi:hypothetical protein